MTPDDIFNTYSWKLLELRSVVQAPVKPKGDLSHSPMPPPLHQLALKTGGCSRILYQGKELLFSDGTLLFIPAEKNYSSVQYDKEILEEGSSIVLFFHMPETFPSEAYVYDLENDRVISALFRQIYNTWMNKQPTTYCDCMALFYRLIAALQKQFAGGYDTEYYRRKLSVSVAYIRKHFCEVKIDQQMLAGLCGMQYDYYRHVFKEVYQVSPVQFINRLKIEYAKELLINRLYSVSEIAEITGFASPYYFDRTFKAHTGLTPTSYRGSSASLLPGLMHD